MLDPASTSVVNRINGWATEHHRVAVDLAAAIDENTAVRAEFKVAWAKLWSLVVGKNNDAREAAVIIRMEQDNNGLYTRKELSDGQVERLRVLLRDAGEQISAAQSNNAALNKQNIPAPPWETNQDRN